MDGVDHGDAVVRDDDEKRPPGRVLQLPTRHAMLPGDLFEAATPLHEERRAFIAATLVEELGVHDRDALAHAVDAAAGRWVELLEEASPAAAARLIAYDALDQNQADDAAELAQQALSIDPNCIDALIVAALHAHDPGEGDDLLALAAEHARAELSMPLAGPAADLRRVAVRGSSERALLALGHRFRERGEFAAAARLFGEVIDRIDPMHLTARLYRIANLLADGDVDSARPALDIEDEDDLLVWAHVLERFLAGDVRGADDALAPARAFSAGLIPYLLGERPLHGRSGLHEAPVEDVDLIADALVPAWSAHPGAIAWLAERVASKPVGRSTCDALALDPFDSEDAAADVAEALFSAFEDSDSGRQYARCRRSIVHAGAFLHAAFERLGVDARRLTPDDVEEILFEILPEHDVLDPEDATEIVEELRAFFEFLEHDLGAPDAAACRAALDEKTIDRLRRRLGV